jgi:hypothetical protein
MRSIALILLGLVTLVHLPDRPDLNSWVMGLRSAGGMPCCEGDEAHALSETEWRVSAEGHYQVFLEGDWRDVPDEAVVQGPNKYGRVLVWYWNVVSDHTDVHIRCFLPAAGA